MATTSNFGWTTPDNSAAVKDGASAIRSLGTAVDTTLVDLKGGTTGQTLSKATNADMDFVWTTAASGGMTLLSTTALSGTSTTVSGISQSYTNLLVQVEGAVTAASSPIYLRFNGITSTSYKLSDITVAGSTSWGTSTSQTRCNTRCYTNTVTNSNILDMTVPNYSNTDMIKRFSWSDMSNQYSQMVIGYLVVSGLSAAITSVTVGDVDDQTLTGGTIKIYGANL
jgi:hypothetical protein